MIKKIKVIIFFFKEGFFDLKKNKFLGKDVVNKVPQKFIWKQGRNDPRINSVSAIWR